VAVPLMFRRIQRVYSQDAFGLFHLFNSYRMSLSSAPGGCPGMTQNWCWENC
jgi:hypothetical protein